MAANKKIESVTMMKENLFITAQLSNDHSLYKRCQHKFQTAVASLVDMGFEFIALYQQRHSLYLTPAVFLLGLRNEVWKFDSFLRISWFHGCYRSKDSVTFVYVFGLGVRFWTFFDDNTALCTMNYKTNSGYQTRAQIHRISVPGSIHNAFTAHNQKIKDLESEGHSILKNAPLEALIDINCREDSPWDALIMGFLGWSAFLAVVYFIVSYLIKIV
ncbi:hypothetical protein OAO01_07900 [Oligoflexia bacterium]|nr:hypothetical protein [Oligoflexia bacterium]